MIRRARIARLPGLLMLLLWLSACQDGHSGTVALADPKPVRLVTVTASPAPAERRFIGRVAPVRTVDVSFQVAGRIARLPVKPGNLLQPSTLLAELDRTDFELALRRAEAEQLQAARTAARAERMYATQGGSRAALDEAETAVELAEVALALARQRLAHTRIEVPFPALVSRRLQEEHANVDAHQPVLRLQDWSELRVHFDLPETLLAVLEEPSAYRFEAIARARPDQRFELFYREHVTEANPLAQSYRVELGMPGPTSSLWLPGMIVTLVITDLQGDRPALPTLPLATLDSRADGSLKVWVYAPETATVQPRSVTLGVVRGEQAEILDGLAEGEQVVAAGWQQLRPGQPVLALDLPTP